MKNRNILTVAAIFLQACAQEPSKPDIRQQVLDMHDTLMNVSSKAISKKIQLDTFSLATLKFNYPDLDTIAERKKIQHLVSELDSLDEKMLDWMHFFNAEFKGKADGERDKYYQLEKRKIIFLDSLYRSAAKSSVLYLEELNTKSKPVKR